MSNERAAHALEIDLETPIIIRMTKGRTRLVDIGTDVVLYLQADTMIRFNHYRPYFEKLAVNYLSAYGKLSADEAIYLSMKYPVNQTANLLNVTKRTAKTIFSVIFHNIRVGRG